MREMNKRNGEKNGKTALLQGWKEKFLVSRVKKGRRNHWGKPLNTTSKGEECSVKK